MAKRSRSSDAETRKGVIALDGSSLDLRGHLAGLFDGSISLDQFHHWFVDAEADIEAHGSDDDVELANLVFSRFAEFTSGYIDAAELLEALKIDAKVAREPLVAAPRQ